jgi:hypothetical protein
VKASDKIVIGAGAAVCTACCAAPIAAFLTAVGLGAVLGVVLFGVVGLVVASLAVPVIARRRRRWGPTAIRR